MLQSMSVLTREYEMPVITTDVLLEQVKRDDAYEWLCDFECHRQFLYATFSIVSDNEISKDKLTLSYDGGFKNRQMEYVLSERDENHGGRRIKIALSGKRTTGYVKYSLRTLKPSSNTMLTIHMDYQSTGVVGWLINKIALQQDLEEHWKRVGQAIVQIMPKSQ